MTQPRFSFYMPSNRPLATSQNSIDALMTFVGDDEQVEVVLADNSGDARKKDHVAARYGARVRYLETTGLGGVDNIAAAMNATTGEFIMMCADDDVLYKMTPRLPTFDAITPRTALVRPTSVLYDDARGITAVSTFSVTQPTAKERIFAYLDVHGMKNTTYYSLIRRELALDVFRLARAHPLSAASYFDWAMVLAHVAAGDLVAEHRMVYAYDESKWSNAERSGNSLLAAFKATGLGPHTADLLWFLVAVDAFLFIARSTSPLARVEALDAGIAGFSVYMELFLKGYEAALPRFTEQERQQLARLGSVSDASSALDVAIGVLDAHDVELGQKYRAFYQTALGHPWGELR